MSFSQSFKIINFAPTLLQIIVSEQVEFPVRQAGKTHTHTTLRSLTPIKWAIKGSRGQQSCWRALSHVLTYQNRFPHPHWSLHWSLVFKHPLSLTSSSFLSFPALTDRDLVLQQHLIHELHRAGHQRVRKPGQQDADSHNHLGMSLTALLNCFGFHIIGLAINCQNWDLLIKLLGDNFCFALLVTIHIKCRQP